jgi:hypothetical protein
LGIYLRKVIVPPFLFQNAGIGQHVRIENRIQVNMHEIKIIGHVHACYRISGIISRSHGVQECIERSLQENVEGTFNREVPGTIQHRMLKNMRRTEIILRKCPESYIEQLVGIIGSDLQKPCPGFFMFEIKAVGIHFLHEPFFNQPEP